MSYIYIIESKANGKFYIGSTLDYKRRKTDHKRDLRKGKHHNILLQRHFNKYGIEDLEFKILKDNCKELSKVEQILIKRLKPQFNIKMNVNRRENYKMSEEQKKLISKKNKGRKVTEETKLKISQTMKGRKFSLAHRKNLSKSAKGNINWKKINYKDKERNRKISISVKKNKSKKVINTETGEIFNSAKEAAESIGMPKSTFTKNVFGFNKKNKTKFKPYEE
jgi:group I intron endonuclease